MPPRAVLIGAPGCGKSVIGRRLARALGVKVLDTDAEIERTAGKTITEIFSAEGEPAFRALEEQVVASALAEHEGVLSLGGGAVLSSKTQEALRGHTVVWLQISAAEGVRRTSRRTHRPILAGENPDERYRQLLAERTPVYRSLATLKVRAEGRPTSSIVRELERRLTAKGTAASEETGAVVETEETPTQEQQA
ncbi:MAG: shikimate kinase [Segniliparus sp.]|uniref:shikimate kinase n=1 Tax=Segniliparus sp. TaxID=2804064 RepID=UPI003F2C6EF4